MSNLPTKTPIETLQISPEALEVANVYLQTQDLDKTCEDLDISKDTAIALLDRREVRAYIDHVFLNLGFNNRFKLREAMDLIIKKKFQELEESETGSSKDIADLLALSHKMTMDELSRQIELEKLRNSNIKNQVNVQINEAGNYQSLIRQLIEGTIDSK